ncbi:MAG: oligosaccharide flippase family protein [bacterium]
MVADFLSNIKENLKDSKKAVEDIVITTIPSVFSIICGLVTSVLIARGLGPEKMGEYTLVLSISGLIPILSDLGIGQSAIRFASRALSQGNIDSQHAVLRWAFRIRIFMVFFTTAIIFLVAPFITGKIWHLDNLANPVRLSLLIGIFITISSIPMVYYQSLKKFKMNALVSIGQTSITLIGILIIFLLNAWSINKIIITSIISTGIGMFIFLLIVPKTIFFNMLKLKSSSFKKLLKDFWRAPADESVRSKNFDGTNLYSFTFYITLASIISTLIYKVDVWLMGYFLNPDQIGIYSVAMRFTLPLTFILSGVQVTIYPKASELTCQKKTAELLKKTFYLCSLISLGFAVYSIFVPLMAPFMFGHEYKDCVLLAQLLCIRYCISILICPLGVISYNFGLVKFSPPINFIQLVIVVLMNIVALPLIGSLSAVIALIISEVFGGLAFGLLIWKKFCKFSGE